MLDKFRGCILGGAMGDSLGYPVEFYNVSFIKNHKLLKEPYNISLFSDDTQMTLFTAEGIVESNGNVLDYIYSAYKYWWATQMRSMPAGHKFVYESKLYKDSRLHDLRAPGNTCLSALAVPFEKVGNNSCGCGGVMRVAPIGLVYDPERAYEIGCEAARFSHLNPLGYEPAGVFSAIISYIISGEDLKSAIKKAIKTFYFKGLNNTQACEALKQEYPDDPVVGHFIEFVSNTERGLQPGNPEMVALGTKNADKDDEE